MSEWLIKASGAVTAALAAVYGLSTLVATMEVSPNGSAWLLALVLAVGAVAGPTLIGVMWVMRTQQYVGRPRSRRPQVGRATPQRDSTAKKPRATRKTDHSKASRLSQ